MNTHPDIRVALARRIWPRFWSAPGGDPAQVAKRPETSKVRDAA